MGCTKSFPGLNIKKIEVFPGFPTFSHVRDVKNLENAAISKLELGPEEAGSFIWIIT